MNFIKGVLGFGKKGKEPENFLDYVGEGRMFLIQKKVKKCVFIVSRITFIQGKKDAYERYIYIKNLSQESEFGTDEYYFSIKPDINLRSYETKDGDDDIVGFEWDLETGATVCYEFGTHVSEDLSSADGFQYHVCRLLYENKHRDSANNATQEELEDFCKDKEEYDKLIESSTQSSVHSQASGLFKPRVSDKKDKTLENESYIRNKEESELNRPIVNQQTLEWNRQREEEANSGTIDDLVNDFNKKVDINRQGSKRESMERREETKTNSAPVNNPQNYGGMAKPVKVDGKSLIEIPTSLCELNENGIAVVLVEKAYLFVVDGGNFQYYLEIFDGNQNILYKRLIGSDLNYHVDDEQSAFKWVEIKLETGDIAVYACKLPVEMLHAFKLVFAQCLFEAANKERVEEIFKKEEERQYARRWFENDIEPIEAVKSQEQDEIEIEDEYIAAQDAPTGQNTGQVQAKVLDRTFVSKGSTLSVFMTNDDDNTLEHLVSLPPVKTLDGIEIMPKKMLMHEQDTKVLMLSDPENTKVYYMDLARGKIVNEFQGDGVNKFTDLAPTSKHSVFTHNPCFITANQRNLFLIDPRVSGDNKCVEEKIYAQAPQFTCICTNDTEGFFATGSEKGEIRLYTKVGQNAKTRFPGLGDPIIGLDSTKDGMWLLATTKTYIMLVQTMVNGKNGYKQSITKDMKIPFKLTILPQHMKKYRMTELNFQPAKFNDNENNNENCIIASTGEFLVTWNLKHVLRGQLNKYEIKRINDYIVSNEFRYKREDNLLVTLPKEVRVQKTKFH